ncbi:MAG: S8 family peptidase [Candidatus Gastranaerophilales bacterium]|nr:S8 family peptidase [Candidatus Gastranaerophilales bacterium]
MVTKLDLYNQMKGEQPSDKQKRIAIVDDFTNKSVFIDADFKPDLTHGEVVSRFLEEGMPDAELVRFNGHCIQATDDEMPSDEENICFLRSISEQLDKILQDIKNGKTYDAINISLGFDVDFAPYSESFGVSLQNIASDKKIIKDWILSPEAQKEHEGWKELGNLIKKLDSISANNIPIYIAAGNKGANFYNLFDLGDNSITVGSLNKKGKKANFSARNSAVDRWEQGVFDIKHITDKNSKIGFDYTGDGTVDITDDKTTAWWKLPNPFKLLGTSVSTPKAIVRDLK